DASILVRTLDRQKVDGLLHHADDRVVAASVLADDTELGLREVAALAAEADLVLHLANRVGERGGFLVRDAQDVEGQALCRAGPHAREARELADQVVDERAEHARELCLQARKTQALEAAHRTA